MSKSELIDQVMEAEQVEPRLMEMLEGTCKNIPNGKKVIKSGKKLFPQLMEVMRLLYKKYYTEEMLVAYLAFCQTEEGKQIVATKHKFEDHVTDVVVTWLNSSMQDAIK